MAHCPSSRSTRCCGARCTSAGGSCCSRDRSSSSSSCSRRGSSTTSSPTGCRTRRSTRRPRCRSTRDGTRVAPGSRRRPTIAVSHCRGAQGGGPLRRRRAAARARRGDRATRGVCRDESSDDDEDASVAWGWRRRCVGVEGRERGFSSSRRCRCHHQHSDQTNNHRRRHHHRRRRSRDHDVAITANNAGGAAPREPFACIVDRPARGGALPSHRCGGGDRGDRAPRAALPPDGRRGGLRRQAPRRGGERVRAALAVEGSKRRALLTRTPRSAMAIVPSVTAATKKTKNMAMGGRSGRHLLVPFCATIRHMAQYTKHRDTHVMAHH